MITERVEAELVADSIRTGRNLQAVSELMLLRSPRVAVPDLTSLFASRMTLAPCLPPSSLAPSGPESPNPVPTDAILEQSGSNTHWQRSTAKGYHEIRQTTEE
eukprot:2942480-Rhodomonas_salina.2